MAARLFWLRLRLPGWIERESFPSAIRRAERSMPRLAMPAARVEGIAERVDRIVREYHLAPSTCLYRAMARYAVLRAAGLQVCFVMGVVPGQDDLAGHAWVEVGGRPYGEELRPGIVVTFSHPGATA